eukprot:CAMPEP_0175964204 /NCGR_PEP_ID=MMETSP0108-20121206/37435_1 /TAXON_ID=195067 ORGANISM="Goniomonas pacifica, Strain CCMP1869" /NCGR_SAMPLE_ID=MMETSP0108 /ASSEMBLY_ACC=CAM_ASM_000204 /LENGTH=526 /DNA_ID=CAMNT_0017292167 /DNA_START=15 /DNA_END=1595 /DNA_ORIENTATION=-
MATALEQGVRSEVSRLSRELAEAQRELAERPSLEASLSLVSVAPPPEVDRLELRCSEMATELAEVKEQRDTLSAMVDNSDGWRQREEELRRELAHAQAEVQRLETAGAEAMARVTCLEEQVSTAARSRDELETTGSDVLSQIEAVVFAEETKTAALNATVRGLEAGLKSKMEVLERRAEDAEAKASEATGKLNKAKQDQLALRREIVALKTAATERTTTTSAGRGERLQSKVVPSEEDDEVVRLRELVASTRRIADQEKRRWGTELRAMARERAEAVGEAERLRRRVDEVEAERMWATKDTEETMAELQRLREAERRAVSTSELSATMSSADPLESSSATLGMVEVDVGHGLLARLEQLVETEQDKRRKAEEVAAEVTSRCEELEWELTETQRARMAANTTDDGRIAAITKVWGERLTAAEEEARRLEREHAEAVRREARLEELVGRLREQHRETEGRLMTAQHSLRVASSHTGVRTPPDARSRKLAAVAAAAELRAQQAEAAKEDAETKLQEATRELWAMRVKFS